MKSLVVLKRVDRSSAHREFAALMRLEDWLQKADGPQGWTVPEPLGVVDIDAEDAVFVMRRLPGYTLAHHALEHLDGRGPNPQRMFELAVSALGGFHAAMWNQPSSYPENVVQTYRKSATQLTSPDQAERSTRELAPVIEPGIQLAKKDAHAGNWLWSSASGGLILVDIEGKSTRPLLLELTTLLDDLPLLGMDPEGWDQRLALAERYVDLLPPQARPHRQELQDRLEGGTLYVAVTGLARIQRHNWGVSSRGIRLAQYQHRHYLELLAFLARAASSASVRRAASDFSL